MNEMKLLKKLTEAFGPSTAEDAVLAIIKEELGPTFTFIETTHKHLIVIPKHRTFKRTIMLQAHTDELGFRPYKYLPDGFIELSPMAGIPQAATNTILEFHPTQNRGILLVKDSGRDASYYLDVGARDDAEAQVMIPYYSNGAYIGIELQESPSQLAGKSFDDRAGCAAIVQVLKEFAHKGPNRIIGVFTAREETGDWPIAELKQAIIEQNVYPELIINLEICPGGPTPLDPSPIARVGNGIVLVHMDGSYAPDAKLCKTMSDIALENKIPHQQIAMRKGSGELGRLALDFGVHGYPLTIPGKYMHCPHSVICKDDYLAAIKMCHLIGKHYEGIKDAAAVRRK